jgi:antitoxin component YwqK of YwqJK toxin-antitoxin module
MAEIEERVDRDEAGRVTRRYHVAGDQLEGECLVYTAEGWVAQRSNFAGGLLDGELTQYDGDGEIAAVMHYRAGKLEGLSRFFDRGRLQLSASYHDGLADGETIVFGEYGKPSAKAEYRAGKLHGLSSWFRPDGTLLRTARFAGGEPDGEPVDYDERGRAKKK